MDLTIHQKRVSFKLEISKKVEATSFAGCALIRETLKRLGLHECMKGFGLKKAGYSDEVILEGLVLLMASGGRSLSDWEYLKGEMGFDRMFGETCPSVDTLERYLRRLRITLPERESDAGQVGYTTLMEGLQKVLVQTMWKKMGSPKKLMIDLDTIILETDKANALYSYEKVKAYQPMNAYCPEMGMVLAHEFRDGNVSPAEGYQRLVERCMELLPGVHFTVRSDSAGYQNDFMDWMTRKRIRYYITADQSGSVQASLSAAHEWKPLIIDGINTGEEVTRILYGASASTIKEMKFRIHTRHYIATRREKEQPDLFEEYIYQVIVTNALWEKSETVVENHRGRCGSVEYFHSQISQLGMDWMPSNSFNVNAAWYALGCFTHNLLRFIQSRLLGKEWKKLEIKTFRFRFLRSVALIVHKARRVILKFCENHPIATVYFRAWERLVTLTG